MPSTPQTYIERDQEGSGYESAPRAYIERGQEGAGQESPPSGAWYYCPDAKKYYPYVNECPGGWQVVPAEPPAEPGR
jgi:hypothetical protein